MELLDVLSSFEGVKCAAGLAVESKVISLLHRKFYLLLKNSIFASQQKCFLKNVSPRSALNGNRLTFKAILCEAKQKISLPQGPFFIIPSATQHLRSAEKVSLYFQQYKAWYYLKEIIDLRFFLRSPRFHFNCTKRKFDSISFRCLSDLRQKVRALTKYIWRREPIFECFSSFRFNSILRWLESEGEKLLHLSWDKKVVCYLNVSASMLRSIEQAFQWSFPYLHWKENDWFVAREADKDILISGRRWNLWLMGVNGLIIICQEQLKFYLNNIALMAQLFSYFPQLISTRKSARLCSLWDLTLNASGVVE